MVMKKMNMRVHAYTSYIPVVVRRLPRQRLEYREVYQGAVHIDQSENPSSVIRCFSSSLEIYP